jgi:hypothetical protein
LEAIADAVLLVVVAVGTTEAMPHHAAVGSVTHPVRSVTHPVMPAGSELVRHGEMPVLHHEAGDGDEPMFLSIIKALIERARRLGQILQSCSKLSD